MTYLGITSIPKPMIEAGESFGATKRQLLWKVELPAPADHHGGPDPVHHAVAVDGGVRDADRRAGLGNPVNRALNNRNIPWALRRAWRSSSRHHPRPHDAP
jgi:glycine betaine/proline transport system permease protein